MVYEPFGLGGAPMRQRRVKGLVLGLIVLAGIIGPAVSSLWAQTVPPDIRGTYVGSGVNTQTSCASAANNGTFLYVVSMTISSQVTDTFSALATFTFSTESVDQVTFSGTVTSSGLLSGTLTLIVLNNGVSVASGSGTFAGQVTGNSLVINYAGKLLVGETCVFAGSLSAVRLITVLAAAVLPSSRSVQVGSAATAFATVINAGPTTGLSCGIAPLTSLPATFTFQTTDPATNQVTGAPNTVVDIAPGTSQPFVIAFTPTGTAPPTDVQLSFACANSVPALIISGVNTLLLSASASPVPDIVALAATVNNDGIVNIPGPTGTGAFAVATVNVGSSAPSSSTRIRAPVHRVAPPRSARDARSSTAIRATRPCSVAASAYASASFRRSVSESASATTSCPDSTNSQYFGMPPTQANFSNDSGSPGRSLQAGQNAG